MGKHLVRDGAIVGLVIGIVVLLLTYLLASHCLSYHIAQPPHPWPTSCEEPVYSSLTGFAFPVTLFTNDLAVAIRLSPLTLVLYAVIGALVASYTSKRSK